MVTNACSGERFLASLTLVMSLMLLSGGTSAAVSSISADLVNADTGEPLPGDYPTHGQAYLFLCGDVDCDSTSLVYLAFQFADSLGHLRFEQDDQGAALAAGRYALGALASGFVPFLTEPFDAADDEDVNLGVLELEPIRLIGSVYGRIVDASTSEPLSPSPPTFGTILERCFEAVCYFWTSAQQDEQGNFVYDGSDHQLPEGDYRVVAYADTYQPGMTDIFFVGEAVDYDIGDLELVPVPIAIGQVQECVLPIGGGHCTFGVEIRNRGDERFKGKAWGRIDVSPATFPSPTQYSQFQVGRMGAKNPKPQNIELQPGEGMMLEFSLDVPGSVPEGSTICGSVYVGQNSHALFNVLAQSYVFCVQQVNGGLQTMSEKEGRRMLKERGKTGEAEKGFKFPVEAARLRIRSRAGGD